MTTLAALRSAAAPPDGGLPEDPPGLIADPPPDPLALTAPRETLDGAMLAADAAVAAQLDREERAPQRARQVVTPTPDPPAAPEPLAVTEAAPAESGSRGSRIISAARGFLGVPYLWGGITRAGMDCSGLTYTVLRSVGLNPPRTAAQQARWTTRIPASQAQPGDLVFLGSPATHVGIYIGNGRMIDSSTPGTVIAERPILAGTYFGRIP